MQGLSSLSAGAGDPPWMPQWITVQSRGMKQWISLELARRLGICANMRFVFPRPLVDEILSRFTSVEGPNETRNEIPDEEYFFWSAMKLIRENRASKELSGLEAYIREDAAGKKCFQVSWKIATLFDDYQVYRPDMLSDWRTGRKNSALKDPSARWQAFLYRKTAEAGRARTFLPGPWIFSKTFHRKNSIWTVFRPGFPFSGSRPCRNCFCTCWKKYPLSWTSICFC